MAVHGPALKRGGSASAIGALRGFAVADERPEETGGNDMLDGL
ncbi:hypothetical protein CSB93_4178 [Pseudomonas paraeruginosa]|uniref:Uncharacterized protein n=1 Tax=Pseudomonas paraeruginosa TaxID=2994495 RepID=A0A2R3J1N3_9PSED|nr:hypothetical protein CSB93_4178 [Pseudomonas paraeruginosa]AWE94189.1 hypothetical protein CSC28_2963 [Pseudomonas paraeruginosa]